MAIRKALTQFQACVRDLDDHFERAPEKGMLEGTPEEIATDHEYLDAKGMDAGAVEGAGERALRNKHCHFLNFDSYKRNDTLCYSAFICPI